MVHDQKARARLRKLAAAAAASLTALSCLPAMGQVEEPALKAAFVYNFAKFVEWPSEVWAKPGKLRICMAGAKNALAEEIAKLESKPAVQGKDIEIRRISDRGEVSGCHILVFTEPELGAAWLASVRGLPVLSVSEAGAFVQGGGIIGFFREADRLRFEINTDAMQRAQVKISSQLLKLARIVKGDGS